MGMNVNQFHNLEQAVGTRFLEYVLNHPTGLLRRDRLEDYAFSSAQLAAAERLLGLLAMSYSATPGYALVSFPSLVPEFNAIRRLCGGSFPTPLETDDEVLECVARLCIENYPVLLLKNDTSIPEMFWRGNRIVRTQGDAHHIVELLDKDLVLRAFLSGGDGTFLKRFEYALENSVRVSCSAWSFVVDLIDSAFVACCYRGNYGLTDLLEEVKAAIFTLRTTGLGKEMSVFHFAGLYGMRLDGVSSVDLGGGVTVRNIDDFYNPLLYGTMSTGTTSDRQGIQLGCVLEYRGSFNRVAVEGDSWTVSLPQFDRIVDSFVMAIVLSGKHQRAPVTKTFTDVYVPLYRHYSDSRPETRGAITCIDEKQLKSVAEWFRLLRDVNIEHVRIPLGRIRAALYERTNPVDGLLDFFIAWESMFSHAVSIRNSVVRSMEVMLARAGKAMSRKRLTELYGLRSAIVHGGAGESGHSELQTPEAREGVRDEACDVALAVFSELLNDKELLQLKPRERVQRLLNPVEEKCEVCKRATLEFS